jgi:oxalate decarboxylase/phosphoglucose isomerase-like protein (cupin superfamily)
MFVLAGTVVVTIGKSRRALRLVPIRVNSLLLIEKRKLHQIKNTGKRPMSALSFIRPQRMMLTACRCNHQFALAPTRELAERVRNLTSKKTADLQSACRLRKLFFRQDFGIRFL